MQDCAMKVRQINNDEFAHVVELIIEGLAERWGHYDPTKNPDLQFFTETYKNSLILVADNGNAPVGVGILRPSVNGASEIVRMSVRQGLRRRGIASKILTELIAAARKGGANAVRVETTATWRSAVAFYETHGFRRTHVQQGDQHFVIEL